MADDGTVEASASRVFFVARGRERRLVLLAGLLIAIACGAITYRLATSTILGRYVRYRAEDAVVSARREVRQATDAVDDWWRHVERTVATRDKRRRPDPMDDADMPRWVGVVDVPPP